MSQEVRNENRGRRDIIRAATGINGSNQLEGFDGMNYEQVRQPYNPNGKGRNGINDKRNNGKRPEES